MHAYPKSVKRMIRKYAEQAYEVELNQALSELEQQFAIWHSGQISTFDLSDRIYAFTRGPSRELWRRYNARLDDHMVARAIVLGLLPRSEMPAELLEALQSIIGFLERRLVEEREESPSDNIQQSESDDVT